MREEVWQLSNFCQGHTAIRRQSGHLNPELLDPSTSRTATVIESALGVSHQAEHLHARNQLIPTTVRSGLCRYLLHFGNEETELLRECITCLWCVDGGATLSPQNSRAQETLKGHKREGPYQGYTVTLTWDRASLKTFLLSAGRVVL